MGHTMVGSWPSVLLHGRDLTTVRPVPGTGPGGHIGLESIVVENLSLLSVPSVFYCNTHLWQKQQKGKCFLLVFTKPETGRRVMGVRSEKRLGTCHWGPLCCAKNLGFLTWMGGQQLRHRNYFRSPGNSPGQMSSSRLSGVLGFPFFQCIYNSWFNSFV